jgi:hypothetical protein
MRGSMPILKNFWLAGEFLRISVVNSYERITTRTSANNVHLRQLWDLVTQIARQAW